MSARSRSSDSISSMAVAGRGFGEFEQFRAQASVSLVLQNPNVLAPARKRLRGCVRFVAAPVVYDEIVEFVAAFLMQRKILREQN